jgi:hypothetical protein
VVQRIRRRIIELKGLGVEFQALVQAVNPIGTEWI